VIKESEFNEFLIVKSISICNGSFCKILFQHVLIKIQPVLKRCIKWKLSA